MCSEGIDCGAGRELDRQRLLGELEVQSQHELSCHDSHGYIEPQEHCSPRLRPNTQSDLPSIIKNRTFMREFHIVTK